MALFMLGAVILAAPRAEALSPCAGHANEVCSADKLVDEHGNLLGDQGFQKDDIAELLQTGVTQTGNSEQPVPMTPYQPVSNAYYEKLPYNNGGCEPGSEIVTYQECVTALVSLGFKSALTYVYNSTTETTMPWGCSVRASDNKEKCEGCNFHEIKKELGHFNGAPYGRARVDLAPICKKKAARTDPNARYEKLPYNTPACPAGHEIATVEECTIAMLSLGLQSAWKGVLQFNIPSVTKACSVREAGVRWLCEGCDPQDLGIEGGHFNSAPTGFARADLAPICKKNPQYVPYQMLPDNAPGCRPGYEISTKGECAMALKILGFKGASNVQEVPSYAAPRHCSMHRASVGSQDQGFFNPAPSGQAGATMAPICQTK